MCVRPSTAFYGSFSLGTGRSPGFGPARTDSCCFCSLALFRLALTPAPRLKRLTCRHAQLAGPFYKKYAVAYTHICIYAPTACGHRVSGSLSLPSRGPFHLSFTVLCSIGHWWVFRLAGWSPHLPPGFHVSRRTLGAACGTVPYAYGAFTLSGRLSQSLSASYRPTPCGPLPRSASRRGLASSPSARRYSGNRFFFLFLRLLGCFGSPGPPPYAMDSRMDTWVPPMWVAPFRYPRITGHLPLPAAFRSLSRLSSAPSARASALCPSCLTHGGFLPPPAAPVASGAGPAGVRVPPHGLAYPWPGFAHAKDKFFSFFFCS